MIDVLKIFMKGGRAATWLGVWIELRFVHAFSFLFWQNDCPGKCLKSVWHFACLSNHDRINLRNLFRHSIFRIRWKDFSDRFWFNFVTTSSFPFRYFKWFKFIRKHISTFEKSFYLTFHWEKFSFHQNKVSRKWAVWHDSMYCNKNISLQQKSDTAIWISW